MAGKRKATTDPTHDDDVDISRPVKKKSLAERKAEAHAKAAAAMKRASKSPTKAVTKPSPKKRAKKSTAATTVDSETESLASSTSSRRSARRSTGTTATRRRGRSTAAAAAVSEFKFEPPIPEEEEESTGTPIKSPEYRKKSIAATSPFTFSAGKNDKEDKRTPEEKARDKRKQREARERFRASMGVKSASGSPKKRGEKKIATASASFVEDVKIKPPSPVSSPENKKAAAASMPSPQKEEAAAVSESKLPPPSLAAIFSTKKRGYTPHRPDADAKFDPNQPFPTRGYQPPVPAYCGCGPTPSIGRSKRGSGGDLCISQESYARKDSYNKLSVPKVDPPYQKMDSYSVVDEDERKKGVDPDGTVVATRASVQMTDVKAVNASIAKANALVSSVEDSNRKRRAALGIKMETKNVAVQMLRVPEVTGKEPEEEVEVVPDDGMEETKVEVAAEIEDETPSFAKRMGKRILSGLFFVMMAQLAFGVYYVATNHIFGASVTQSNVTKASSLVDESKSIEEGKQPNCFIDHPADFFTPNEEIDEHCAGKFVPCPQWGRCHAGILRDCDDAGNVFRGVKRFTPNTQKNACIPTNEAQNFVFMVKTVLTGMTVTQTCNVWDKLGKKHVVPPTDGQSYPLFRMERVVESMEILATDRKVNDTEFYSPELLRWLEPVDSSVLRYGSFSTKEDVIDAVGLANDISPDSLPLPLACSAGIILWELFTMSFGIFWYLAKFAWHYIYHFPLISTVVMFVSFIVSLVMKRKRHLAKIKEAYPQMLDATYDRLAEADDNGYPALMLRDDIVREMYPTNLKARTFLYNDVWPRVVAEIHSDNRVRKYRKEANGKNLEHWDLHLQPKKGRRLRKSLGSAPKLDDAVKEEAPAVGRDP